jgi:tol-pal system protein YbgF
MTRLWWLPPACPTLCLAVFAIAASAPMVCAQDATVQERLDRIERDLSMLQRQVYRDGVSPGDDTGSSSGGNLAVQTQIRMDRLEEEMRDLTGKVEDEANQVQQLRQRLEQVNNDIAVRFGELNPQAAGAHPGAPSPARRETRSESFASSAGRDSVDVPGYEPPPAAADALPGTQPGAYEPPADTAGTLTPPGMAPPPTPPPGQMAAMGPAPQLPEPNLPSASASAQYNAAFGLLRRADYSDAADAFRSFVQQHPDSSLAGNAQYWLGESYYARGRYADAAVAFAEGYKRYPKGPKASETLLKLAMALSRSEQKQNACVALAQLGHDFQHSSSAVKERAVAEKRRNGC